MPSNIYAQTQLTSIQLMHKVVVLNSDSKWIPKGNRMKHQNDGAKTLVALINWHGQEILAKMQIFSLVINLIASNLLQITEKKRRKRKLVYWQQK